MRMRLTGALLLAAAIAMVALPAIAELQNVQVGGNIRIRGNWYMNYNPEPTGAEIRWPGVFLPKRPIGTPGNTIVSPFAWDNNTNDTKFVEQRTRLNVKADFTDQVSAYIELDSYDVWGEDFRSNYITGADFRAATGDDVEVLQSYIEANEMYGYPLRLRIGRQELAFGNQWLIGDNDTASFFTGLSFDAIRLTYATDLFSVDAFAAKLADRGVTEQDGDIDLYGIYASYLGIENVSLDAYWFWLRDARSLNDTNFVWFVEWIEDALNLDDYDPTNLHTVGLRGAGTIGQFDFEAEAAYQFGDADSVGFRFAPLTYGDDDADFSAWAANAEVGYTFDMTYQPRVFLGGAYFDGEDKRDISWLDWINPFYTPEASVSFNRLFSNVEYSPILDANHLSNFWVGRGGVSVKPTEAVEVMLAASYFDTVDEFDAPYYIKLGRYRLPLFPGRSYAARPNDSDLGWEIDLTATYNYTEDLSFEVGYSHLFTGGGLEQGNFNNFNGLGFDGGSNNDDVDYLYFQTKLNF